MQDHYDVFLSYSHEDRKNAKYFHSRLNAAGVRCFMAEKDIELGQVWKKEIQEKIKFSKIVLFLITPHSNESQWVKLEAGVAWGLEKTIISARMFVETSEMIEVLREHQSSNIEDRNSQDELINQILEKIDFSAFWKLLINEKSPQEYTYALPSAKVGIEFEGGKPTEKTGHTVLVSYNEFNAILNLQRELDPLGNKIRVAHGGANVVDESGAKLVIPKFPRHANLIVIGSSHANVICSDIMSSSKLYDPPYKFDLIKEGKETDKCILSKDGEKFPSQIRSKEKVLSEDTSKLHEDYGIILRVTNPFQGGDDNKILILGGNHGLGTEAAIKFVTNRELIKFLRKKTDDDDFEALFKADLREKREQRDVEHLFKAELDENKELGFRILKIFKLKSGKWSLAYSS